MRRAMFWAVAAFGTCILFGLNFVQALIVTVIATAAGT